MIRRFLLVAAILHALYAVAWYGFGEFNELVFERWSVTVCATVLTLTYGAFALAYLWANKTRLNTALSLHKVYLFLLFGLLTLPSLWGVALRDAPYRVVGNPFSYWIAPAWLRTYLYLGVAITSAGSLYEFGRANRWFRKNAPAATVPGDDRVVYQGYDRRGPELGKRIGDA